VSLTIDARTYAHPEFIGRWQQEAQAHDALDQRYAIGQSVPCSYDPSNPERFSLPHSNVGERVGFVMALLFEAFFLLAFVLTLRRYRRWKAGMGT
jgi:hypothetical protein